MLSGRIGMLADPARTRLGDVVRPDDDDRTKSLRGLLLNTAAVLADDPAAGHHCRALLDRFLADPASVEPSLSAPALTAAATLGDVALHETLVAAFEAASNPQDRERILRSLSRFRHPAALARTLDLTLSGSVRTQDAPFVLAEATANRDNAAAAGPSSPRTGTRSTSGSRPTASPRMLGGIRSIRDQALAARGHDVPGRAPGARRARCRSASTSSAWA